MKKSLIAVAILVTAGACSGGHSVVSVDGTSFQVDDIPVTTESSTIDLATFRNALNWVIRDEVLVAAAEEEFGVSFVDEELTERASAALDALTEAEQEDPRANLNYFLIQARVGLEGLMWPQVEPQLPDGVSQNDWAVEKLEAATIEVDARYGEWRTDPEPLVYAP